MSEPASPNDRLSYHRGVLESLRKTYETYSHEDLLNLACDLAKTYVVEGTIPFDLPIPEREDESRQAAKGGDEPLPDGVPDAAPDPELAPHRQFARLVESLRKRFAHLPQFEAFAIEEGRAVVQVDNQRIVFGERTTVEFVSNRARVPGRTLDAAAAPAPAPSPPPPPPASPGARTEPPSRGAGSPFDAPPPRPRPTPDDRRREPLREAGRAVPVQGPLPRQQGPAPGAPPPSPADKKKTDSQRRPAAQEDIEQFRRLDLD